MDYCQPRSFDASTSATPIALSSLSSGKDRNPENTSMLHNRTGKRTSVDPNDPQPDCQWISGKDADEAMSELLLKVVTPVAVEVTLAVQQELQARWDEVERLRKEQVERD